MAQFFDAPTHLRYLEELSEIVIEYSVYAGGNANQAILLAMWLATLLNWKAVSSTRRHPGTDLRLHFGESGRQIQVVIFGREGFDVPPGRLISVALHVQHEPQATFQITQSHQYHATTRWKIGKKVTGRSAALQIPDEAALVCSELDVTHRDRIYQHALQMLEQLSA